VAVRVARTAAVLLIVGATLYSVLILRADTEWADFGREAITALVRPHVLAGQKVWFPNQYSAYWYAPLVGAELTVPGVQEPSRGDLFIVGGGVDWDTTGTLKKFPNRTLIEALTHKYRFGRTMEHSAGLYSNWDGTNWLWRLGNSDDDRYELWRID
jgi:hypothetical protein